MTNKAREWLKQAAYDVETAEYMAQGGRHFYTVFMCHLAIEKGLKGLYHDRLARIPPKTHSLVYLLTEVGVQPPERLGRFVVKLNEASVATRYPESLERLSAAYTEGIAREIVATTKEVLQWIDQQL